MSSAGLLCPWFICLQYSAYFFQLFNLVQMLLIWKSFNCLKIFYSFNQLEIMVKYFSERKNYYWICDISSGRNASCNINLRNIQRIKWTVENIAEYTLCQFRGLSCGLARFFLKLCKHWITSNGWDAATLENGTRQPKAIWWERYEAGRDSWVDNYRLGVPIHSAFSLISIHVPQMQSDLDPSCFKLSLYMVLLS